MPAQSNITVNTVTYTPNGRDQNGVAGWANRALSASSPRTITESVRGPLANGNHRVMFKLSIPKVATEDSSCGCAGSLLSTAIATIELVIPGNMTLAERTDLRLQLTGLIGHAVFTDAVDNLTGSW